MISPFLRRQRSILSYVERHLAEGQQHISKMQSLIADGERRGFDMSEAHIRLGEFLVAQSTREHHREHLLAEIDQSEW